MPPESELKEDVLDDLPFYLSRIYYAFLGVVDRTLAERGLDDRLKPGMGHVLFALYEQDNCIIKKIAQRVQIAPATLTGLLGRMEKAGLIERRRCSDDGRAQRVQLTELGRSLAEPLKDFHVQIQSVVQSGLSPEEVREAKRLLGHILQSLHSEQERQELAKLRGVRPGTSE